MLSYHFFPTVGGTERQCLLQAKTLKSNGYTVQVLTTEQPGLPACDHVDGIPVHRKILTRSFSVFQLVLFIGSVVSFLLKHRKEYDIVHVHQLNAITVGACLAKIITGKPVVCKLACSKPYSDFDIIRGMRFPKLYFKILKRVDFFLAISKELIAEAENNGFGEKVLYLPNGVFVPDEIVWKGEVRKVLFLARITHQKGADIFVDAANLNCSGKYEYILVGTGDMEIQLRKKASANTVFAGTTSHPEDYLDDPSTVFALPSRAEGLSNSLLEAMARGIPSVISSSVSGALDMAGKKLDGRPLFSLHENLILVQPENPEALNAAIDYLSAHSEYASLISQNSRNFIISRFSINHVCTELEKLYKKLLERKAV